MKLKLAYHNFVCSNSEEKYSILANSVGLIVEENLQYLIHEGVEGHA